MARLHRASSTDGGKVKIADREGGHRWHEIWQYAPSVARPGEAYSATIVNGGGARPYIDHVRSDKRRWVWRNWECPVGELVGIRHDDRGAGRILVEPSIKLGASPNKQWHHWQALVDNHPQVPWAQMCPPGKQALRGVHRIETRSFIDACSVLATATAAVLPDGGLHHAAAALGRRAVVIMGGYIGEHQTGYATHVNIHDNIACGFRVPCKHCKRAMNNISPEVVASALSTIVGVL